MQFVKRNAPAPSGLCHLFATIFAVCLKGLCKGGKKEATYEYSVQCLTDFDDNMSLGTGQLTTTTTTTTREKKVVLQYSGLIHFHIIGVRLCAYVNKVKSHYFL